MRDSAPVQLLRICDDIVREGGDPYFVGGCVRDDKLGLWPKDYDTEVFGMTANKLCEVLARHGRIDLVGKSYAVFKVQPGDGEAAYDFSLPRRDSKTGKGHQDFDVEADPSMSTKDAAQRRDFTINSMMYSVARNEIIDHFDGGFHLDAKILAVVKPKTFKEDPLRVLRGMQFTSRFKLKPSYDTILACQSLFETYSTLPRERVWVEWYKWASMSTKPSYGLTFLFATWWLNHLPQIVKIVGLQQDPAWHPEGDVFSHTCYVCDAAADIADREGLVGEDKAVLLLAALCHDFGKATTTVHDGLPPRWRSPGHAEAGVEPAREFLESIGCLERITQRVLPLVQEHMVHTNKDITRRMVRRLKFRMQPHGEMKMLLLLMEADHSGRPPLPKGVPDGTYKIASLDIDLPKKIEPILMGRHLIERGFKPGPMMGTILQRALKAQLDEKFDDLDGALAWLESAESAESA